MTRQGTRQQVVRESDRTRGAGQVSRINEPRNRTKACVRVEQRHGRSCVVKDYSRLHPLLRRLYGRVVIWREMRAYARLAGVPGIPRCYGREDAWALVVEHLDGTPLSSFRRGELDAAVFDRLDGMLTVMHARGVVHADLHRSNVLIGEKGQVCLIDFASALLSRRPGRIGPVLRMVMRLDRQAAARMRARYLRQDPPRAPGLFGLVYAACKRVKKIKKRALKRCRQMAAAEEDSR